MAIVKFQHPVTRSLNSMLDDILNDMPSTVRSTGNALHYPPVNILEHDGQYQILVAIPGVDKADISISTEQNLLHISTEKKAVDDTAKCLRREFEIKPFKRSFSLQEDIDAENITASVENGILKLELPRKSKQVRQIEVK